MEEILRKLTALEAEYPDQYLDNLIEAIHHGHTYRMQRSVPYSLWTKEGKPPIFL